MECLQVAYTGQTSAPSYAPCMAVCPSCGEENPDRFRLCGFCGTPLVVALPPQEVRKTVTVVFSDLKGSTTLGERLDSESLREVMTRYFEEMRARSRSTAAGSRSTSATRSWLSSGCRGPRGRRTPRRARGGRDEAAARRPERGARDPVGGHAREPHGREYRGGRGRRPDCRPAAGGRRHGQRRGPARAGGDGERGARRRADVPARPEQRPGRACGATRAEGQGRARPRLSTAHGRGGRHRAAPAAAPGRTRGRAGHPRRRVRRRGPRRHLPDGHDRRAGGRRQVTPDRGVLRPHRPTATTLRGRCLRTGGHHVLAAGRDRPPGGLDRGRGRADVARGKIAPGRRCRGDRAGRSCGRPGRRDPGPGALLGRAEAAGKHRLGAAARAQVRRHPLGRGDAARPDRAPPDDHRRSTAAPPVRDPGGSPRAARLARGLRRDRRAGAARRRRSQPGDRARPRDGRRAGRGRGRIVEAAEGNPLFVEQLLLDARRRRLLVLDENGWRATSDLSEGLALPRVESRRF